MGGCANRRVGGVPGNGQTWWTPGPGEQGETLRGLQARLDSPDLVRGVRSGDGTAISRVLDLCLPSLRQVVSAQFGLSPEESEDVLQEVRIAFWQAATRFRGECSLQTYLVQIARRKSADYLRLRRRHALRSEALDDEQVAADDGPLGKAVERLAVAEALAKLSVRQRELLELYYTQRKSYQEIAGEMGIAIGTVGGMKAEALRKLRDALSEGGLESSDAG